MDVVTLGAALSIMKKMPDTAASSAAAAEDAADRAEAAQAAAEAAAEQAEGAIEVDDTLSVKGKAADAKAVGDKITGLKEDLNSIANEQLFSIDNLAFINASLSNSDGETYTASNNYLTMTGYAKKTDLINYNFTAGQVTTLYVFSYDSNYQYMQRDTVGSNSSIFAAPGYYLRFSFYKSGITEEDVKNALALAINTGLNDRIENIKKQSVHAIHNIGTNYIDFTKLATSKFINGSVSGQGAEVSSAGYNATDFIELEAGVPYYFSGLYQHYFAFYDSEKHFVSGGGASDNIPSIIVLPEGAKYFRGTIDKNTNLSTVYLYTSMFSPPTYSDNAVDYANHIPLLTPCDYSGKEISMFKKILCIGDSITAGALNGDTPGGESVLTGIRGYDYPTQMAKMTGCEITNLGVGGATIEAWWTGHQNDDLSGHDLCIIMLGINNALQSREWTASAETAMTNIINKVKSDNAGISIVVCTPMISKNYTEYQLRLVAQGIRNLISGMNDPSVKLLDIASYGHTRDYVSYSCGHLSAYGYWRLANDIINGIGYVINKSKTDYRFVQFAGTQYTWNDQNK